MNTLSNFEANLLNSISPARKPVVMNLGIDATREVYSNTDGDRDRDGVRVDFAASARTPEGVSLAGASPAISLKTASRPGEEKSGNTITLGRTRRPDRKVSTQDLYVLINASMGNVRSGETDRSTVYLSLREESDPRFSIFLRAALTSRIREVRASIEKTDNKPLQTILDDIVAQNNDGQMIGRIRYNARRGLIQEMHRKNLKHGLFEVHSQQGKLVGTLFLLGEEYPFEFTTGSVKQQQHFDAVATYQAEIGEFEGSEEMADE
jgi:hypothetical protein